MKYIIYISIFLSIISPLIARDTYRTFTNHNGQAIMAQIINTEHDNVKLRRKDLKLSYLLIKRNVGIGNTKNDNKGRLSGEVGKISIEVLVPKSTHKFNSKIVNIREVNLKSGYWTGGGDNKNNDKLEGIFIRVYKDDILLHEYANPKSAASYNWKELVGKK